MVCALGIALSGQAEAGSIWLAWDAPPEQVTGYIVHSGSQSGVYTQGVDVGNVTSYVVTGLTTGQVYYFVVQSYNDAGTSSFSAEVSGPAETPVFHPLTVTLGGPGTGTVSSGPAGIDCGADCTEAYLRGTSVTLTPVVGANSTFVGWTGNADCADGVVGMAAATSCIATFDLSTHPLTVALAGTGIGTVASVPAGIDCGADCEEVYTFGTVATLTPIPMPGSTFTGWSGDADCVNEELWAPGATLTWNQNDTDANALTYRLYLDNVPQGTLENVACNTSSLPAACTASFPSGFALTAGVYVMQLEAERAGTASGLGPGVVASVASGSLGYPISVTIDAARSCTATFDRPPNQPPVLTDPGTLSSVEGAVISLGLVASDPDGDTLSYGATGLPSGLSLDPATGLISGTIALTAAAGGPYTVTATVSDGLLSAGATFTWTVTVLPTSSGFEGYGVVTRGAESSPSGYDTFHVTSLADSGVGTLRDAVSTGYRHIVFDIAGTITLASDLNIRWSYLTIDGASAPSPGITIVQPGNIGTAIEGRVSTGPTHDIIIHHLRMDGLATGHTNQGDIWGLDGASAPVSNVIIDHVTAIGATDGVFDIWSDVTDVTLSWNVILDTVTASHVSTADVDVSRRRVSIHHNVFARNNERQVRFRHDTQQIDFVNNVVYGWGWMDGGAGGLDIAYDSGEVNPSLNIEHNVLHHVAGLSGTPDDAVRFGRGSAEGQVFFSGNILPAGEGDGVSTSGRNPTPAYAQVTTYDAATLPDTVVPLAGTQYPTAAEQQLLCEIRGALLGLAAGSCAPNGAPTALATTSQAGVPCVGPEGAPVTLDGSGSTDPDGDPLTFAWRDAAGTVIGTTAHVPLTLPLGSHVFSLTVSDGQATDTASVVVTVVDNASPLLSVATALIETDTSFAGTVAELVGAAGVSAVDACDLAPVVGASPTGPYAVGDTVVTFTATDASGNQVQVSVVVRVPDTTPPTLTQPPPLTVEAAGPTDAVVSYAAPTATDLVDPTPTVVCVPISGTTFGWGATTVTCTATDASGNAAAVSFQVTVVDTAPPTLSQPADLVVEADGPTEAVVTYALPTASDLVDPTLAVACVPASGTTFGWGATSVTCTTSDAAGNQAAVSFQVTVVDLTPPTLSQPADLVVEAAGPTGAMVSYAAPTATDLVDPTPTVACVPISGTTFGLGVTSVTCTATDAAGNQAQASFDVTVADTTPPSVNQPADLGVEADGPTGAVVSYTPPTASDLVDPTPTVACLPASGTVFGLGATTVTCTATDATGNQTAVSFQVEVSFLAAVADTTPPSLGLPDDVTAVATGPSGATVTYAPPTATDLMDPTPTVACLPASGTVFGLGATTVTCRATDASGNQAQAGFEVTVSDRTPPTLAQPADVMVGAEGPAGAVVTYAPPTASDLVDPTSTVVCADQPTNGFTTGTPVRTTSFTFRVASVRPWTLAVAARRPSTTGRGSGTFSRPHSSAIARSTGRIRLPCARTSRRSQRSNAAAARRSRRRMLSIPRRISPTVRTLRRMESGSSDSNHLLTRELPRTPFRSSARTLVSSRNFTAAPSVRSPSAGQNRHPHRRSAF